MNPKNVAVFTGVIVVVAVLYLSFDRPHADDRPAPEVVTAVSGEYLTDFGDEQDWNTCVDKHKTEWGGGCMNYGFSETKYSVKLINKCSEPVDLMCCVQYENGRWQCFYRMDMTGRDTLNAYACRGTGKFLKWVRKAGDVTTKFPTREQVNSEY